MGMEQVIADYGHRVRDKLTPKWVLPIALLLLGLNCIIYIFGSDFGDFFDVVQFVSDRNPYHDAPLYDKIANYPPLGYVYFYLYSVIASLGGGITMASPSGCACCVAFLAIPLILSLILIWKNMDAPASRSVASLILLASYPILMAVARANINLTLMPLILFFIYYMDSPDRRIRFLALLSVAVAGSIKIYPLALLGMYLYERRFREFVLSIAVTAALLVLPFLFFKGGFSNISLFVGFLSGFQEVDGSNFNPEDMSFVGIFRGIGLMVGADVGLMASVGKAVMLVTVLVAWISGFFTEDRLTRVLILVLIMATAPSPNYTYALVMALPIIVCLFDRVLNGGDHACMAPLLLMMPLIAKNYLDSLPIFIICLAIAWFYMRRHRDIHTRFAVWVLAALTVINGIIDILASASVWPYDMYFYFVSAAYGLLVALPLVVCIAQILPAAFRERKSAQRPA